MSRAQPLRPQWGAHLDDGGTAHFRLWAPALDTVLLRLERAGDLPMERGHGGWFELTRPDLTDGTRYRFVLPDGTAVPDPASRAQESGVHGPSLLTRSTFDWQASGWCGRPLEEVVIYELHTGVFSPEGTFDGIRQRLDHIAGTGFTAIEIMPVAQFSGNRGWGYDGVLLYCPHAAYGGAGALKRLVDAAHQRGLMVFLDVVYNHFGPDGNYLASYAPDFFDKERHTPWGPGIRFEEPAVRAFFSDNAIYWLEDFRFDGLRFDAIDQIRDSSASPILADIARRIRATFPDRHIHLFTEDERNIIALHPRDADNRPVLFSAEWNDDFHHAAHCIATGEDQGYYAGYADDPIGDLARCLAEGFVYQGENYSPWGSQPRGVPSSGQPPTALVAFLQNHDQIGNRAFGERLTTLASEETIELLTALLLLNPQLPLVFMGEEFDERRPFLFFTDFHGDLAAAVRQGRKREFAAFAQFGSGLAEQLPDPNDADTLAASRLDWGRTEADPGRRRLDLFRNLLALRRQHLVPQLDAMTSMQGSHVRLSDTAFSVRWNMGERSLLMIANFGEDTALNPPLDSSAAFVYESRPGTLAEFRRGVLPARSVTVLFLTDETLP